MIEEIWKPVKDYEGLYEVSNFGRVKSLVKQNDKILKIKKDKYGYFRVGFSVKNRKQRPLVHRLVAIAFLPNPKNLPQVNHKRGVKTDNRTTELEWCTNLENMQHAWNIGLRNNNHLKKSVVQIKNDEIVKIWDSQVEACRELGITQAALSSCCAGRNKSCIGFQWKFV